MAEREKAVKCLRQLRNLLIDDTDLKIPIHDEKFLIRFVRGKKYDVEAAHATVRKYYTIRKKSPKIFQFVYPSYDPVKEIIEKNIVMKLKYDDPLGRAIVVWNTSRWEVEQYNLDKMLAALFLILEEMLIFSVETPINGVIFLVDEETLSFSHVKECSPGRMRSACQVLQGSFPLRLKKAIFVKEPPVIETLMLLVNPFLTAKFKERIVFCGQQLEKLHEIIPAENLPKNFGGKLSDDEAYDQELKENLFKRDSYYRELLDYGFGEWDSDDEDTYM